MRHACLILVSTLVLLAQAAPGHGLRYAVFAFDRDFPPYTYMENNQATGFALDLLTSILAESRWRLTYAPGNWDAVQRELSQGVADITAGMGKTAEREQTYLFASLPFAEFEVVLLAPSGTTLRTRDELEGMKISVQRGSLYEQILTRIGGFDLVRYDTEREALEAMVDGRTIAFCGAAKTALYNARTMGAGTLRRIGPPLYESLLYFALNKSRTELKQAVDEGMARALESGLYADTYRRWFDRDPEEEMAAVKQAATQQ